MIMKSLKNSYHLNNYFQKTDTEQLRNQHDDSILVSLSIITM